MDNKSFDKELLAKFSDFLKIHGKDFQVTPKNLLIYDGDIRTIQSSLGNLSISVEQDAIGNRLNFDLLAPGYQIIFHQWLDQVLQPENIKSPFFILDTTGNVTIIENRESQFTVAVIEFENEVNNIFTYYELFNVLAEENFSDHHNHAKEEFVLYSSTKGVIRITYTTAAPRISDKRFPVESVKRLILFLQDKQYKPYFVNALFMLFKGEPAVSLTEIINSADSLVKVIHRDYELVLKQFDFDKFKDAFLKEKDKYFNSIRDIVSKVYNQLIGIPVSISASVFATYKVDDDLSTLVLIAAGFLFYVILYIKIQLDYKNDVNTVKDDFERDFEVIKSKSGLSEDVIMTERTKVLQKIEQVKGTIHLLIGTILILGSSFLIYLTVQMLEVIGNCFWVRLFFKG